MNLKVISLPLALVAVLLTSTAGAESPGTAPNTELAPDLCAELDEYGDPVRCEPVGRDMAPWWDAEVCCDDRTCTEPSEVGCAAGLELYWCENAVLYGDGTLDCVYEVPNFCDMYPCGPGDITAPPLDHAICCYQEGCYDHEGGLCGGIELWCSNGVSNDDGTVTCLDGEE